MITRARQFLEYDVWQPAPQASRAGRWARLCVQGGIAVAEGVQQDLIVLRAGALTYYTALSIVPLLALVAALLSALGVRSILPQMLEPLAQISPEMAQTIQGFVENVNFGSLGTLGGAMLLLTTVFGIGSVERALNAIWGIKRGRSLQRRLPDYLAVLVVSPVFLGVAVSLSTALSSQALVQQLLRFPGFEAAYGVGLRATPILLYGVGFGFLYWFMPNTRVRPVSAALGSAIATIAFVALSWLYVDLQVGVARANTLFGGVAFVPITIVWIYLCWVLLLVGAECAYVHQNLGTLRLSRVGGPPPPAAREALGLAVAARLAHAFVERGQGLAAEDLAQELQLPEREVRGTIDDLESAGILAPRGDPHEGIYQLGRSPERVGVGDLLEALRGPRDPDGRLRAHAPQLIGLLQELDAGSAAALQGRTLADLAALSRSSSPPRS